MLLASTHWGILNHVCEFQLKWTSIFDVMSENPVFSFKIPGPARVLLPILPTLPPFQKSCCEDGTCQLSTKFDWRGTHIEAKICKLEKEGNFIWYDRKKMINFKSFWFVFTVNHRGWSQSSPGPICLLSVCNITTSPLCFL